jgi:hypothetical protein
VAVSPPSEILINVVGYLPVGVVLAALGTTRAIAATILLCTVAEASQTVIVHRDPSVFDAVANILGGLAGVAAANAASVGTAAIRISRLRAAAAFGAAALLTTLVWHMSGGPLNARGVTRPGALEAHWPLDGVTGRIARDSSGYHVDGRYRTEPTTVAGKLAGAVLFDGSRDAVDFGQATGFRLIGSMTVSAWIRAAAFPADDAAIVSTFAHVPGMALGWQLDTTVDRGARTIGFKLADECGELIARYGATPLRVDTWYHAAGVYDAERQSIHVFLNGALDDGFLLGSVSALHRPSRQPATVGRRSDRDGFEFAGAIDDVRLYSFPLTNPQIADVMAGKDVSTPARAPEVQPAARRRHCQWQSEPADARLPAAIALVGGFVAITLAGLWPARGGGAILAACLLTGLALVPLTAPTLPAAKIWIIPLIAGGEGLAVVKSLTRGPERGFPDPPGADLKKVNG